MPTYHVNVTLHLGNSTVTMSSIVEAEESGVGLINLTVARVLEKGQTKAISDSRRYEGRGSDLDLVHGPEPLTDRRGAIRDQKARKRNG